MNRLFANIKGYTKNAIIVLDYILWLLFDPSKFRIINKDKIKKVVVIHLGAYGEILASTPILSELKKKINADVYYMLKEGKDQVLNNNPNVDEIIIYQENYKKNVENLKKENIDAAIILWPGSYKLAKMCKHAGIKIRVGCFRGFGDGLSFLFTRRIFPLWREHAVVSNAEMVRMLGIRNDYPKIEFYLDNKDVMKVREFLKKKKVKDFVIIHPGYGNSKGLEPNLRLWPPERYAEVADYIINKYKVKIIFTGSNRDKVIAEEIFRLSKNKDKIIVSNGLFTFNELGTLMSLSRMLLCPNTAVSHLAAALDVPLVDLLTKNDAYEWHPWTNKNRYRELTHFEGTTYFERAYSDVGMKCNLAITVDEVKKAVDEMMVLSK